MRSYDDDYCAVFRHRQFYVVATGKAPDMHREHMSTKKDTLLAARTIQIERGMDPNFILDLTNVDPEEIPEFLK